jgi:hypothetical protein
MTIIINGTTGISGVDGSASAPALKGNDTDTGIFYPTANEVAASAGSATVWNASSSFGFKNRLINGDMGIWQRGTSGFTSGQYGADRWVVINNTSASQNSDVPSSAFSFSFDFANSSASFPLIAQRIESANCQDLVGQQVTVSAWAKNISGTSNLFFELNYANAKDNFSAITQIQTVTVSASPSASWTYYSATFNALPSQVANGLEVRIVRNNVSAAQTRVTGVQLERGTVATSFDHLSYGTELALCQRYCEIVKMTGMTGTAGDGNKIGVAQPYKVTKRATPTLTITNATAGNYNMFRPGVEAVITSPTIVVSYGDADVFMIELGTFSGLTNNNSWTGRYNAGTFLTSAEL